MMDSGDLVENGLTVPTTLDSANKEVDFKVIETSVAAEDAKKDDGDFQDSEAEELDIEDGETDNFGDDERDSLGQPSPRRVTSGSGASLNRSLSSSTGTAASGRSKRKGSRSSLRRSSASLPLTTSSSSSSETEEGGFDNGHTSEEFSSLSPRPPRILRPSSSSGGGARRNRKTSSSPTTAAPGGDTNLKVSEIERALGNEDPLVGLEMLRELAVSKNGLVNDDMRRRAWPRLANVTGVDLDADLPTQEECEQHPEYNQVVMDVNRSLKRFPPGIAEDDRPGLQDQLTRLIVRVLLKHRTLHYYQGYHDVAITFLLVVGEVLGYHIMQRLSISHLKEFMAPTMDRTTYLLHYMYPLIQKRNPEVHDFLEHCEVGTIFALPWMITWFGHVLPDYEDVVRLYDFFLSKPPLTPVYFAAALVLHRGAEVTRCEPDMAMVHHLLSKIPDELPFEHLLTETERLYHEFPPSTLEKDVKERYRRYREQMLPPPKKKRPSKTGPSFNAIGVGVTVLAGVAVVAGIVAFRWLNSNPAAATGSTV